MADSYLDAPAVIIWIFFLVWRTWLAGKIDGKIAPLSSSVGGNRSVVYVWTVFLNTLTNNQHWLVTLHYVKVRGKRPDHMLLFDGNKTRVYFTILSLILWPNISVMNIAPSWSIVKLTQHFHKTFNHHYHSQIYSIAKQRCYESGIKILLDSWGREGIDDTGRNKFLWRQITVTARCKADAMA